MSSPDIMNVGIDLGGDRLRVAAGSGGSAALVGHSLSDKPLIRVLQFDSQDKGQSVPRLTVSSLKRLLDFETAVPVPPTGRNSVDCLSDILSGVRAECRLPEHCRCVLAVPPCFSQRQRSALRTATVQSGFGDVRLIDELLAALVACEPEVADARNVLVFAWGASVFSVGLYQKQKKHYKAVAQEGDRYLGGDDIDSLIASEALARMAAADGLRIERLRDVEFFNTLLTESRTAKESLCAGAPAVLRIPRDGRRNGELFRDGTGEGIRLEPDVCATRVTEMIHRTLSLTDAVLEAGGCQNPDAIVLVGGLTRLSALKQTVEKRFRCPVLAAPDSAVAVGAVMVAAVLGRQPESRQEREPPVEPAPPHLDEPAPEVRPDPILTRGGEWAKNFVPLIDLAEEHESSGRLPEAIGAFEDLLQELARFGCELYRRRAAELVDEGKQADAYDLLCTALERAPHSRHVAVDLARIAIQEGEHRYADGTRSRTRRPERTARVTSALAMAESGIHALEGLGAGSADYAAFLGRLYHLKCLCLCALGRVRDAAAASESSLRFCPDDEIFRRTAEQLTKEAGKLKPKEEARERRPRRTPGILERRKLGRNDPCPCGSGLKHKKCCGR